MLVAGTNFVLTYFALKGKILKVFKSEEFRYFLLGIIGISTVIIIVVYFFQDPNPSSFQERHQIYHLTGLISYRGL